MVSEWPPMETATDIMQTDGDNHADLFGGDLFSDELLDIYNSAAGEDETEHSEVPLENVGIPPHLMGQNGDLSQTTKDMNNNSMGYSLGELRSSSSMNDFTSILESPQQSSTMMATTTTMATTASIAATTTTTTNVDTMLVDRTNTVGTAVAAPQTQVQAQVQPLQQQPQQLAPQQQQQQPQTTTVGKKRVADVPQANPCVKKKATGKGSTKVGNRGSTTTTTGRRTSVTKNDNTAKKSNTTVGKTNSTICNDISDVKKTISKDVKGDNNGNKVAGANITDPLTLQAPRALAQKVTMNKNKVQTALPVPVAQQPTHVPSSYQPAKAQPMVTTSAPRPTTAAKVSSSASTASASSVKTEESFKGVAQAAVNNLILSAGQNAARYEAGKSENNPFSKPVDTSTSHVAALTSNNWVAACAASISDAPPGTAEAAQAAALAAASDPAAAKAARARRATLTADERARQNRDRNREHARNTRLRKKAYVEELKRTLTELVTTRDTAELERRHEKQRELEVREVRYRVMEEFLKLRSKGSEANLLARWVAILEDGFTLTLPRTDYRDVVQNHMPRQVSRTSVNATDLLTDPTVQVLRGPTECFDDAAKVAIFLQSLSNGNIVQAYNCDRKKFMMDGINAMLEWTFTSTNMDNTANIILKGCMRATFSPASNKLVCAELLFDSGSVVAQVKSLMSIQEVHNPSSGFSCIAETDALLDSVLPQAPPSQSIQSVKQEGNAPPCSVSVEGDTSSDEEFLVQQQCKQEPSE